MLLDTATKEEKALIVINTFYREKELCNGVLLLAFLLEHSPKLKAYCRMSSNENVNRLLYTNRILIGVT